jgi:subtilase family serine protease
MAAPASSSAGPAAPIRVGSAPLLARGAKAVGALPADVRLHLTVVLKGRDPAGLTAFAHAVSTPGTSAYHDYLTPSQFAARFGAGTGQVRAVQANLRAHGLIPGAVSANRLSIPLTGTAAQVGRAFAVSFRRMVLPGGRNATIASAAPALDASVASDVQSVLGLSSLSQFHPLATLRSVLTPTTHPRLKAAAKHSATGGPQPCSAASSAASSQGAYTADQIASAYRFSDLYQAGDQGQGQTVAIYELEPNDPNDIAAYQSCFGTRASVSYIPVDGGAGTGEGAGEAALDIENAIGLAPKANYLVYQGPNSNSSAPGSGPYDIFNAIISQDRAQVISVSWGECESSNTDGLQAENTLFQEAAAQGQSIVSASGDEGSEDCFAPPPSIPSTSLAVDDPASQPFVTGVGGTTLSTLGPPPGETVWNNGPVAGLDGSGGAGGGGTSSIWSIPSYQSGAAASLHVGQSGSREVPDVAADADPNTGYIVYWNGSGADVASAAGWQAIGGTSASAPLWAALLADINASSACHGSPVGFANPALYRAAGTAYGSDFNDITSGNNDLLGLNGGRFAAGPFYDMASGLGTPQAGGLAATLCKATLRVTNPGSQRTTVGQSVGLQLNTAGPVAGRISWRASGLPAGLSISGSTGRVSGRPRTAGVYSVVVSGSDQTGALSQTRFSWTIVGLPTISRVSLTGVARGRPTLSLTIVSGARAAALKSVTIALPAGLRFAARRGAVTVTGARGGRVSFSARIVRGRLQITLASPQTKIGVRVTYAGISTTGGLAGRVRGHRVKSLQVTVTATDAARHGSTLTAHVRPV